MSTDYRRQAGRDRLELILAVLFDEAPHSLEGRTYVMKLTFLLQQEADTSEIVAAAYAAVPTYASEASWRSNLWNNVGTALREGRGGLAGRKDVTDSTTTKVCNRLLNGRERFNQPRFCRLRQMTAE